MSFSDLKSLESLPADRRRDDRSGQPHPHRACCQNLPADDVDQIGAHAPADVDAVPFLAAESEARDGQLGKLLPEPLQVMLALFLRGRRRNRANLEAARIQGPPEAAHDTALAGCIPSLEHDDRPLAGQIVSLGQCCICKFISSVCAAIFSFKLAMITSDPASTRNTMSTPNASARILLVLSGPVVM